MIPARNYSAEGRKKYTEGKQFEELFDRSCFRDRIDSVVFPQGGQYKGKRFIPVRTPCDRILMFEGGHVVFVDCKSFGEIKHLTKSCLTEHQVLSMSRFVEKGCVAGYVVHFRELQSVFFFHASLLLRCFQNYGPIEPHQGISLGSWTEMHPGRIFDEYHKV